MLSAKQNMKMHTFDATTWNTFYYVDLENCFQFLRWILPNTLNFDVKYELRKIPEYMKQQKTLFVYRFQVIFYVCTGQLPWSHCFKWWIDKTIVIDHRALHFWIGFCFIWFLLEVFESRYFKVKRKTHKK